MNNSNRRASKDTFKGDNDKLRKAKHRTVQKTVSSKDKNSESNNGKK